MKKLISGLLVLCLLMALMPAAAIPVGATGVVGTYENDGPPPQPAEGEPPADEEPQRPPEEAPPATEPPETRPPETQPPETEPPVTEPPATEPPATKPADEDQREPVSWDTELPTLEELYGEEEQLSDMEKLLLAGLGGLLLVLLAAVVVLLVRRRKPELKPGVRSEDEGVDLVALADNGIRLQFHSGKRVAANQSFTIGRAPDNGVVLTANAVSARHCEIVVQNGMLYVRDMGSKNGTFVEGCRIPVGQMVPLKPDMTVGLGGAIGPEAFKVVLSSKKKC